MRYEIGELYRFSPTSTYGELGDFMGLMSTTTSVFDSIKMLSLWEQDPLFRHLIGTIIRGATMDQLEYDVRPDSRVFE